MRRSSVFPALLICLIALALGCQGGQPESPEITEVQVFKLGGVPSADGVPIAYTQQGHGPTAVVLIHGWSCDRTFWQEQVDPLAEDYHVFAIDLAGHGDSGMDRQNWIVPAFGEDVRAMVEKHDLDRVVLVGHSMGGPVALEAARLMPDRVIGVIAVDALQDAEYEFDPERLKEWMRSWDEEFTGTCDRFVRSMFLEDADPELVDRVAREMCDAPPEVAVALMRHMPDYDTKAAMSAVTVPIRAINAAWYPTNVEGNRKYAADYDAVIMEGVGHFLMMEKPEEFNLRLKEVLAEIAGE